MGVNTGWIALAAVMATGAASAQLTPPSEAPSPPPVIIAPVPVPRPVSPATGVTADKRPQFRRITLTRLVAKLPDKQVFETYRIGMFCAGNYTKTWTAGETTVAVTPILASTVREAVREAGFAQEDSDNIFERSTVQTSDTELGGIIDDASMNYCLRTAPARYGVAASSSITGTSTLSIEWQIYDRPTKTVLAKIHTTADYEIRTPERGNSGLLFNGSFRENVKKLVASPEFRTALLTPESHDLVASVSTKQTPIPLPGALAAGPRAVPDAVGAVVLILTGAGEGSGFLVSSDGLLLTNQHVVADSKFVKVRWSDGIEALGEVIRTDKVRDVALVKTDPRGRKPLALRRDPLQPGDTVFAIGAPLGDKYQNTVTRGVVSANRTFDGLSFIQSDVSVTHGSSGGPLLDEKGEAVGMTKGGVIGAPSGMNMFIPVGDALTFLSAKPM